jgi:hypothetical protein
MSDKEVNKEVYAIKTFPKVTLAFLSFNRYYYFRATLESAKKCIQYPNLEWIVYDNASCERMLVRYLNSLNWIDKLIISDNTMAEAMNLIIGEATGDLILIWPDDVQFIVQGRWLNNYVKLLCSHEEIGSLGINCLRELTIKSKFTFRRWANVRSIAAEIRKRKTSFRKQTIYTIDKINIARSMGWTSYGVIGAGICSLSRKSVWTSLGGWSQSDVGYDKLIDSSLGAETNMLQKAEKSQPILQTAISILPVSADIVTDSKGTKAKVRGNIRYGNYMKPPSGLFYYKIYDENELKRINSMKKPLSFEKMVKPIGYNLAFDKNGNLIKTDINSEIKQKIQ